MLILPVIDDPRRLARSIGVAALFGLVGGVCVWLFLRQMPGDRAVRLLHLKPMDAKLAPLAMEQAWTE